MQVARVVAVRVARVVAVRVARVVAIRVAHVVAVRVPHWGCAVAGAPLSEQLGCSYAGCLQLSSLQVDADAVFQGVSG